MAGSKNYPGSDPYHGLGLYEYEASMSQSHGIRDFFKWTLAILGIGLAAIILLLAFAFVAMTVFGS